MFIGVMLFMKGSGVLSFDVCITAWAPELEPPTIEEAAPFLERRLGLGLVIDLKLWLRSWLVARS